VFAVIRDFAVEAALMLLFVEKRAIDPGGVLVIIEMTDGVAAVDISRVQYEFGRFFCRDRVFFFYHDPYLGFSSVGQLFQERTVFVC
jgi:hypothetical protein